MSLSEPDQSRCPGIVVSWPILESGVCSRIVQDAEQASEETQSGLSHEKSRKVEARSKRCYMLRDEWKTEAASGGVGDDQDVRQGCQSLHLS